MAANKRFKGLPMVAFDGFDRCLVNLTKGTVVKYKYFDLAETKSIDITGGQNKTALTFTVKKGRGDILNFTLMGEN